MVIRSKEPTNNMTNYETLQNMAQVAQRVALSGNQEVKSLNITFDGRGKARVAVTVRATAWVDMSDPNNF